MQRILIVTIAMLLGSGLVSYSQTKETKEIICPRHTLSTSTLLGLEYSYEHYTDGALSFVIRAGMPNVVTWLNSMALNRPLMVGLASFAGGVSLEPHFYTSYGTDGGYNASKWFGVRLQGLVVDMIPNMEASIVMMRGYRIMWNRHWMGELSLGGGTSYYSGYNNIAFKPHCMFRLSYVL